MGTGGPFSTAGFQGYLDLAADAPDPVTHVARVSITGASQYISIDLNPSTPVALCIHPIVPVTPAGILACGGGLALGSKVTQDHSLGVVGVNGFTAVDCTAAGGTVEGPTAPHAGVCNGPPVGMAFGTDSGAGALLIVPDQANGLQGFPAEVTVETALPCGDEGPPGNPVAFAFTSGIFRADVTDANNTAGTSITHEEVGENFSCANWKQEDGAGKLVVSTPVLDVMVQGTPVQDLVVAVVFDD